MDTEYFSGCNYYINKGNNEHEPIGTAQSMHECGDCSKLNICKLKKTEWTWKFNKEIEKQMDEDFKSMKYQVKL